MDNCGKNDFSVSCHSYLISFALSALSMKRILSYEVCSTGKLCDVASGVLEKSNQIMILFFQNRIKVLLVIMSVALRIVQLSPTLMKLQSLLTICHHGKMHHADLDTICSNLRIIC